MYIALYFGELFSRINNPNRLLGYCIKNFYHSHYHCLHICLFYGSNENMNLFIYLFEFLRPFQHCTGHITMGSFMGRGNQYTQLVKVLYYKLPTIDNQLPTFPHKVWGLNHQPQKREISMLPLCHCDPQLHNENR